MKVKYIPNILSTIRLLSVPVFVYLFLKRHTVAAIIVFILSGVTDVVDGFIARKYNVSSTLGKILDPLADKSLQLSAFICLAVTKLVPAWMPVMYFVKELATAVGAFVIFRKKKFVTKSNVFGKLATVLVFAFVSVVSVLRDVIPNAAVTVMCVAVCLYFVFSCVMYARAYIFGGKQGDLQDNKNEEEISLN